jgi:hypothetical protein
MDRSEIENRTEEQAEETPAEPKDIFVKNPPPRSKVAISRGRKITAKTPDAADHWDDRIWRRAGR